MKYSTLVAYKNQSGAKLSEKLSCIHSFHKVKIRFQGWLYVWLYVCSSTFTHRATIQWSSLINAGARSALRVHPQHVHTHAYKPNGPQYSMGLIVSRATHRIIYTPSIRHGRYCRQMEHMINIERRSWQKKKRKVCVSMCLNCTHVRSGPCQSSSEAFWCKPGALLLWKC